MKYLASIIALLLFLQMGRAQEARNPFPLRISLFTHSIGMPFKKPIKRPLNWGFSAGTTFYYKVGDRSSWGQDLDIAWYRHKELGKGIMVTTAILREYQTASGLSFGAKAGLGYLHTFTEKELFNLNDSGSYEKIRDTGRSSLVLGFGLRMGFDFGKRSDFPLKPFVEYDWKGQIPHSKFSVILPHSLFKLGAQYSFSR